MKRGNGRGSIYKRGGAGFYYIQWYDQNDARKTECTGTVEKAIAEQILAKKLSDVALRVAGVIDARLEAIAIESAKPIEQHIVAYEKHLAAGGRGADHVRDTLRFIRRFKDAAEWATIADIEHDDATRFAATLKDDNKSARTIASYLTGIKGFTRWLWRTRKLHADPLVGVSKPDPESDRRRQRRMLLPDEWAWLKAAAINGPPLYGMGGEERSILYATSIQTGLRANELRSLSRAQLHLLNDPPFVTCKAGSTKNKKPAKQYIKPDLAQQIRQLVAMKLPNAPVFAMPSKFECAAMIREDLAAARKAWIEAAQHDPDEQERRQQSDFLAPSDLDGRTFDFHTLRHTCGAWLCLHGAHSKAVQVVMRHSSIKLTMDTYGHLLPGQEADTVAKLPEMFEPATLRAATCAATAMRAQCDTMRRGATEADDGQNEERRKLSPGAALCGVMRDSAKTCERGRRDSNPQPPDRQSDFSGQCRSTEISPPSTTCDDASASEHSPRCNLDCNDFEDVAFLLRLHVATHMEGDIE